MGPRLRGLPIVRNRSRVTPGWLISHGNCGHYPTALRRAWGTIIHMPSLRETESSAHSLPTLYHHDHHEHLPSRFPQVLRGRSGRHARLQHLQRIRPRTDPPGPRSPALSGTAVLPTFTFADKRPKACERFKDELRTSGQHPSRQAGCVRHPSSRCPRVPSRDRRRGVRGQECGVGQR